MTFIMNIQDEEAVTQLLQRDLPAWQAGKRCFNSTLFDLMNTANSHNRHKLQNAYPLEMIAFKRYQRKQ